MNFFNGDELNFFCRLCLRRNQDLVDIFDSIEPSLHTEEMTLSAKIMACVSIEVLPSGREPRKICSKCLSSINSWHEFKMTCDSANNILQKYLQDTSEKNKQVAEKVTASEDSILFPEISLFNYDSLLERSVSIGSNISSIVNYFLSSEKNKEKIEVDQLPECNNFCDKIEKPESPKYPTIEISEPDEDDTKPKNKKKGYTCELCNQYFTHFSILLTHDESIHPEELRKHCCNICGRLFILQDRLDIHIKLAHRQKSFQCPICDKFFVSSKSLQVHSRLHSEMYKCRKCGYLSTSKIGLNNHMQKHDGVNISFMCKICEKMFSQKSSLRRHEILHSKYQGKCFRCSICHLLHRSHSELLAHMDSHKESVNFEVFTCRICSKNFKSKKVWVTHLRKHEEPQFSCTVCEKKLWSKYDLRIHMDTHSDSKIFNCFHCSKKFSFKNTLIRHVKKHYPRIRSDVPNDC